MPDKFFQKRLEEIAPTLSKRDKVVLSSVRRFRYLTTKQIQQLHFTDASTPAARLKATNRNLNKLQELGLTEALARRIGGVRAGSGSRIWYVTDGGERLLRIGSSSAHPRKRFFEPSPHFLEHTLAVAECYLQFTKICTGHNMKLVDAEMEPGCWRPYNHKGRIITLKPDMFAVTDCGDFEDRWFIEIDLDTQAPISIVEKCQRYHDYYRSGLEQKQHEIFPLVVWIVPDIARKESLIRHIRDEFRKLPKIFIVITPDELKPLIRQGAEHTGGITLC
jgi:hypothetical protein